MRGHQHHEDHAPAREAHRRRPDPVGPHAGLDLQRMIGNAAVGDLISRSEAAQTEAAEEQAAATHGVVNSSGRPLDDTVRTEMESKLGADFSDVRVHTDRAAHESAASLAARAWTSGPHIAFQQGQYDPASASGRAVIAHELTHVVQQRRGPVAGTDTGGGLAVSDPSDPFEREAERVESGELTGTSSAAATAPAAGAGAALPIARMMSLADFRRRTSVGLLEKRGSSIQRVEQALAAYHNVPVDNFVGRRQRLRELSDAASDYFNHSKSQRHQGVVKEVDDASHAESNEIRVPALMQEILARVAAHDDIFRQLQEAKNEAVPLEQARRLLTAQEAILAQNPAADSDLAGANTSLQTWLNLVVGGLPEADRRRLVEDDLRLLNDIRADPAAPPVTRQILGDLLARRGNIAFTTGMPGTTRAPADATEGYTTRHMMSQAGGATERLGSLAHELTHVDAGETYNNTDILLLVRRDLSDAEISDVTRQRVARIDQLTTLLAADDTLTADQKDLVRNKLNYAKTPTKGVARYAANFRSKLDDATYARLVRIEELSAPNSSVLVEYDTVVSQILVYLHRWGADQQQPFYAAIMRLAAELQADRAAA